MKKTSASIVLALILDIVFGLLFMFLIISFKNEDKSISFYMNQIGIFKEENNANKSIEELNELDLNAYTYLNDDLYIVVTSITLDKEKCIQDQNILNSNQIKYILKEITTTDLNLINELKQNNLEKVMELMSK